MRLSPQSQRIIRESVRQVFGPQARVRLFESRVDDAARGGDIDLLVELDEQVDDRERKALSLIARLQMRLGDQPIDVLVLDPQTSRRPIHEQAFRTGVAL
jgi:predicted nucleotidyltransferase